MITSFVNLCMMSIDHIMWAEPSQANETRDPEFRFIQFLFKVLKGSFISNSLIFLFLFILYFIYLNHNIFFRCFFTILA